MVRLAVAVVSLLLLAHGADGTYRAVRSRTQAPMTCADFAREGSSSAWLRLTGCEVDYVHAAYRESSARINELLFAVRPAGAGPDTPAPLVLSTRDPEVLSIAERTLGHGGTIDQEAFLVMMLQVVTAMRV